MKDTPLIYVVRCWVDPECGQPDLDWLKDKHMAEVVAEPGILWARRVMLDRADDAGWRFWRELEGFHDDHYSDRFWGDVDVAIDDPG